MHLDVNLRDHILIVDRSFGQITDGSCLDNVFHEVPLDGLVLHVVGRRHSEGGKQEGGGRRRELDGCVRVAYRSAPESPA